MATIRKLPKATSNNDETQLPRRALLENEEKVLKETGQTKKQ
jgi:hypothetical protein